MQWIFYVTAQQLFFIPILLTCTRTVIIWKNTSSRLKFDEKYQHHEIKLRVDKKLNFWRHFAYIHIKNSFCTVLFLDSLKVTYLLLNLLIFSYFEYFWSTAVRGTINLTVRTGNLKLTFVVNFSHNSSAIICYAYFVKLHSYNKTLKTIHRSKLKFDEKYQPHVIRPRVDSKSNFWRHFAIIHIKISFLARFYS